MFDDYKMFDQDQFEALFSHPPVEVSSIIRCSPLGACAEALAATLLSSALDNPLSIDALVPSLVADLSTTEALFY